MTMTPNRIRATKKNEQICYIWGKQKKKHCFRLELVGRESIVNSHTEFKYDVPNMGSKWHAAFLPLLYSRINVQCT